MAYLKHLFTDCNHFDTFKRSLQETASKPFIVGPNLALKISSCLEFLIMLRIFNHAQNFWSKIKKSNQDQERLRE